MALSSEAAVSSDDVLISGAAALGVASRLGEAAPDPTTGAAAATETGAPQTGDPQRSAADRFARRLLRVPDRGSGEVYNIFSSSILLSATRCLLSYIVFPVLAPWLSELPLIGPAIGIPIAVAALVFDVRAVRRFFLADHRRRWAATALYVVVMVMVSYLLVRDVVRLA